jgi:hypothetical protein
MSGTIGILNVGAGDTKLSFDKDNPMERARSARIVADMLKRGYVLFIEVPGHEGKSYQRVLEFREDVCEYIIADLDPAIAAPEPKEETPVHEPSNEAEGEAGSPAENEIPAPAPRGRGRKRKSVDAGIVHGVAVGRTAGG